MKVLIASQRLAIIAPQLREKLPNDVQLIIPKTGSEEELIQLARDVEVIICVRLSPKVAQAATKLRLIQKTGAGVDALPFNVLGKSVAVANTSSANPIPMAEGAVALVLALAKQIVSRHTRFQQGERGPEKSIELRGKTVGIIGLGHIGEEVAHILQAFNMKIQGLKRHPHKPLKTRLGLEFLGGPHDLAYLLQTSDFVIVTAPLTSETEGLIGEGELRLMKPTAHIINVSRAAIIQEEPLYRALKEGWIAGAALDVWWTPHWWDSKWNPNGEPPSQYPIWTLPNVIATPHNIGSTDTLIQPRLKIVAENILRLAAGKPLINRVNKELQY